VAGPFFIRFRNADRGREPDLVFFGTERNSQLRRWFIESPVDLVVEVVSPESVRRERAIKLLEYEREGIHEYWLFDPLTRAPEFYRLGADGRYQIVYPVDGIYTSEAVPGFQLDIAELFAPLDRLPPFAD
jgi:Uma2 family endonuclease